jgi:hypothetical protein
MLTTGGEGLLEDRRIAAGVPSTTMVAVPANEKLIALEVALPEEAVTVTVSEVELISVMLAVRVPLLSVVPVAGENATRPDCPEALKVISAPLTA